MSRRQARPDMFQQLSFLKGRLPLLLLVVSLVFFQMWKVLGSQELASRVFDEERLCASYTGELQLQRTRYQELSAYARIEREGRRLGLVWPEEGVGRIVLREDEARRDLRVGGRGQ